MPTWGELSNFTWAELRTLKWADLSVDKYTLLQKLWNDEVSLSPEAENKLKDLCKPFANEYQKHYGKKLNIKDSLSSAVKFLRLLMDIHKLYIDYGPEIQKALAVILDFLFSQLG